MLPAQSPPRSPTVLAPTVAIATATPEIPRTASPVDEEKALNAAAAREVSRELDALMFNSPLKAAESPVPAQRPDPLEVPDRPFVRRYAPRRSSLGGDSITSPASVRNETSFTRERDRSAVTSSPTSSLAPNSPTVSSSHGHSADGHDAPSQPPAPAALPPPPIPSTTSSSASSTPFRTPLSEFPAPRGPGSFYNLPSASASGGISPSGARTISAAAFKRQLRSPSSPPPPDAPQASTSPLVVNKRAPGSPLPTPRLQPGEPLQRVSSAPDPRRASAAPFGSHQEGEHQEEDSYDYISAYMDDGPTSAGSGHGQGQGQGQGYELGRFATNLESGGGVR